MKMKAALVLWQTAVLMVVGALYVSRVEANHNLFQYKFPCNPQDACYVTQLAHVGNAFDFDPLGSAGLGDIRAVSEGTFRGYVTVSEVCTTSGLGMYAVIDDMHGRTLRYAHLSAFAGLQEDQRVLQGDLVGIEGNTGYTIDCAPHLHLEGIATAPGIDGIDISSITAGPTLYQSTNSVVGAYNLPGAAIQQKYFDLGEPFTSWATVGWTADWTGSQSGCAQTPFCRLYVHYAPNPETGHWGSLQTFRKHPGAAVTDDGSIMAGRWGRWNQTTRQFDPVFDPYWVEQPFFAAWLGNLQVGGLAIRDAVGPGAMCGSSECCPLSVGCVRYQRLHTGYIWEHETQGVQSTVFCPDIAPPYPYQDYRIDAPNDILSIKFKYGANDRGLAPYEHWPDAWYDVNGDGRIDAPNDILPVMMSYQMRCYPQ